MRDSLYQQLEWRYGLGGPYIQVAATGETGILGLATGQTAGGIRIVHMYRYIFASGPPSCSDWRGEQDEAMVLPVCVQVLSVLISLADYSM